MALRARRSEEHYQLADRSMAHPVRRHATFWVGLSIPLLLALAAYVGLCVFFAVNQREFQYSLGGGRTTPEQVGLIGFRAIDVRTEDGERLDAWWVPPPKAGRGVVLFLHGTPGTLAGTTWILPDFRDSGLGVMAIDYRGYGGSTGIPTEAGLRRDARAAFDHIRAAAPGARIAVFGESLGTGPAVALARDRPVAGVVLNAPYASVRRLFELRGPPIPYRWLMLDQFDSEALIGGITAPLMILHGTLDRAIPVAEARRLYAAAPAPKTMVEVEGVGHLAAYAGDGRQRALDALVRWTQP
jgi:alpha-beta hydrolase superfamily lysophospholipase